MLKVGLCVYPSFRFVVPALARRLKRHPVLVDQTRRDAVSDAGVVTGFMALTDVRGPAKAGNFISKKLSLGLRALL